MSKSHNEKKILKKARAIIHRMGFEGLDCSIENESLRVSGYLEDYNSKVALGLALGKLPVRGILNDVQVPGISEDQIPAPAYRDNDLAGRRFDAVIVGAGVIGCAIARELSRYEISVAVLEKEDDVAVHTSSRNDGMIHPGLAPSPGSQKAHYNIRGNRMYDQTSRELGFAFRRPGSLALFEKPWMILLVPILKRRCRQNAVDGDYRYVSAREVRRLEPNVRKKQYGGFLLPSAGVVSPFEVTIAYAENAVENGASFFFETLVEGINKDEDGRISSVDTSRGRIHTSLLINAAGLWSDRLAEYAGDRFFQIHPRRGVDAILDKKLHKTQSHILSMPQWLSSSDTHSKGGGLITCIEGNLLAGPTSKETPLREDYQTSDEELRELMHHLSLNSVIKNDDIITYFAGVRAATWKEDFVIERSQKVPNLLHAAGIQSPGLASAPAIGEDIASMAIEVLSERQSIGKNVDFNPLRKTRLKPRDMTEDERNALIQRDPAYGRVICRCEEVSEGEVRDCLHSVLGVAGVDAVKRRTRAGAGRCHGGFCLPRVLEIIRTEQHINIIEVEKKGRGSWITTPM